MHDLPSTSIYLCERFEKPRFRVRQSSIHIALLTVLFCTANGALFRFGQTTGTIWIIATAMIVVHAAKHPKSMSIMLAKHWAILLLPLFAILSTVWSASPEETIRDGVQMFVTCIIALHFSSILTTRQIMLSLAIALASATAASVLNLITGLLQPVYETNGALLGIFTQKNNFAKAVFWGAFSLTAVSLYDRKVWLGIAYCIITFPLTMSAASKTGQIGYLFIILLLATVTARHLSTKARLLCFAMIGSTAGALVAIYIYTGGSPTGDMLNLIGKGPTLTGRTVIWDLGLDVWRKNMLVGIGMNAFWSSPSYADAVAFISSNVDDGLQGFHNLYVEYLVAFGVVGATYLIILLIGNWINLLKDVLISWSVETAIWLSILSALIVFGGFEDSFSKPRSGHLILAIMAFSYSKLRTNSLRWRVS